MGRRRPQWQQHQHQPPRQQTPPPPPAPAPVPVAATPVPPVEPRYLLRFDGGCRGNPGPGGAGAVLYRNGAEWASRYTYMQDRTTNNRAEYTGLIEGLKLAAQLGVPRLLVEGDSKLVINQVFGTWQCRHPALQPLRALALQQVAKFQCCTGEYIPRAGNVDADTLVNRALDLRNSKIAMPNQPAAALFAGAPGPAPAAAAASSSSSSSSSEHENKRRRLDGGAGGSGSSSLGKAVVRVKAINPALSVCFCGHPELFVRDGVHRCCFLGRLLCPSCGTRWVVEKYMACCPVSCPSCHQSCEAYQRDPLQ